MKTTAPDEQFPAKAIKEIPKWTRRYAQNRTLPSLLFLFLFLVWGLSARATSQFARESFRAGDMIEFYCAMAGVAALVALLIWFMVPRWGGAWFRSVTKRIDNKDGDVVLLEPEKQRTSKWRRQLKRSAGLLMLGVPVTMLLTRWGYVPSDYMQPVSALYVVPFLIVTFVSMRPAAGPVYLLWPVLYCIHAILVVAGAPIQFEGRWEILNMMIPVVGYGILTGVVGYLFGRYSLNRLRDILSRGATRP